MYGISRFSLSKTRYFVPRSRRSSQIRVSTKKIENFFLTFLADFVHPFSDICNFMPITIKLAVFDFDFVIVANGHYTKPSLPALFENCDFEGRIIHSHVYRAVSKFFFIFFFNFWKPLKGVLKSLPTKMFLLLVLDLLARIFQSIYYQLREKSAYWAERKFQIYLKQSRCL